jgi:L-lactate permease
MGHENFSRASPFAATFVALPWCCLSVFLFSSGAFTASGAMALDRQIGMIVLPLISWPLLLFAHIRFWMGAQTVLKSTFVLVSTFTVGYFSIVQFHGSWLWDAFCGGLSSFEVQYLIVKDFFTRLL